MNAGRKSALALILILIATAAGIGATPAGPTDQPLMQEARAELQQAKASLQRAKPNKGGHRTKAISLIQSAIDQVNLGIQFARDHAHGVVMMADQPNMQDALAHLQTAKTKLQNAAEDKGGHRKNALELVNQAIDEVNKGIAAAD